LKAGWLDGTLTKSGQQLELGSTRVIPWNNLSSTPFHSESPNVSLNNWGETSYTILIIHHAACSIKTSRMGRDSRGFYKQEM